MTTSEFLLSAWDFEPSIVIGCAALVIGYLLFSGRAGRTYYFLGGILLLFLDLVSPLDRLADEYLLSAHVLQHFLLALIIPILIVLGAPRSISNFTPQFHPVMAWLLGVGTMLLWHVPVFFNAALANQALHIFQHLSFLITGTIFWWPVLAPREENRLAAMPAVTYLFSACTVCSLLGAALTFFPPGAYPAYVHPEDQLSIHVLIRNGWGLDAKGDQQLAGMLMWVPGCFVYLSVILATVARWYCAAEQV